MPRHRGRPHILCQHLTRLYMPLRRTPLCITLQCTTLLRIRLQPITLSQVIQRQSMLMPCRCILSSTLIRILTQIPRGIMPLRLRMLIIQVSLKLIQL
ncbi:hypothetical protein GCM10007853_28220 [Algimonas ampicilliniresistens]|uniref:Uncharacterized protein n=1 Tax=Algimonas ampicilliniresistens TaxID=1298735 RepID=A0ABQ5VBT1_9PROT|nr:hypothetical protein GCM10007853_28220 [Algimonas ampicilliniresistens]